MYDLHIQKVGKNLLIDLLTNNCKVKHMRDHTIQQRKITKIRICFTRGGFWVEHEYHIGFLTVTLLFSVN